MGSVGKDVISMTQSPISLYNQTFGLTNDSTLDFMRASCDGIFVSSHRRLASSMFCLSFQLTSALQLTSLSCLGATA